MLRNLVVLSMAVGLAAFAGGCGNACEDAAKDLTDLAAACDTPVTYTFTGDCDDTAKACIVACDSFVQTADTCDTAGATDCMNACINGTGLGGGGTGGAGGSP